MIDATHHVILYANGEKYGVNQSQRIADVVNKPVVGQSLHLMIDSRRPPFFCLGSRRPQYMQQSPRGGGLSGTLLPP